MSDGDRVIAVIAAVFVVTVSTWSDLLVWQTEAAIEYRDSNNEWTFVKTRQRERKLTQKEITRKVTQTMESKTASLCWNKYDENEERGQMGWMAVKWFLMLSGRPAGVSGPGGEMRTFCSVESARTDK